MRIWTLVVLFARYVEIPKTCKRTAFENMDRSGIYSHQGRESQGQNGGGGGRRVTLRRGRDRSVSPHLLLPWGNAVNSWHIWFRARYNERQIIYAYGFSRRGAKGGRIVRQSPTGYSGDALGPRRGASFDEARQCPATLFVGSSNHVHELFNMIDEQQHDC